MLDQISSRHLLREAFGRVRENGGCRGADGVTVGAFAANLERELDRLEASLLRRSYRPLPLLRFEVPKRGGGSRPLVVPAVRDRVLQTAVHLATRSLFEAEFEEVSHAYRQGRSVRTAIHRVDELRRQGYGWVVDADIQSFFDNIPHDRLLARLRRLPLDPYVLQLFELWIRAEVYDGARILTLAAGIPQGSVVSPTLANLFLDELDENLALFGQRVVRYGDDFLVLCRGPREAEQALELTDYLVAQLELQLNRDKSRTTSFEQGFQFLGAVFLKDSIYLPFHHPEPEHAPPYLPPPLDLVAYLELKGAPVSPTGLRILETRLTRDP